MNIYDNCIYLFYLVFGISHLEIRVCCFVCFCFCFISSFIFIHKSDKTHMRSRTHRNLYGF